MDGDHDDLLYKDFQNQSQLQLGSFWQLHAAACFSSPLYPQLPTSPTPQVPAGPESRRPWTPWWPLVPPADGCPQQPGGLHSYILFHSGTKLSVVLNRAAYRPGPGPAQPSRHRHQGGARASIAKYHRTTDDDAVRQSIISSRHIMTPRCECLRTRNPIFNVIGFRAADIRII